MQELRPTHESSSWEETKNHHCPLMKAFLKHKFRGDNQHKPNFAVQDFSRVDHFLGEKNHLQHLHLRVARAVVTSKSIC